MNGKHCGWRQGVSIDDAEAAKWHREPAHQGLGKTFYALAVLCADHHLGFQKI
jgi:hypothetical protein